MPRFGRVMTRDDALRLVSEMRSALDGFEEGLKRGAFDPCDCGHSKIEHGDVHEGPAAGYRPCLVAGCDCVHFDDAGQQIAELRRKDRLAAADKAAFEGRAAA